MVTQRKEFARKVRNGAKTRLHCRGSSGTYDLRDGGRVPEERPRPVTFVGMNSMVTLNEGNEEIEPTASSSESPPVGAIKSYLFNVQSQAFR